MDGLEDQAEASLQGVLEQLCTQETVEIKHSSRDTVVFRITEVLKNHHLRNPEEPIVAKSLVFRSGISVAGLHMLQQALRSYDALEALEFVSLRSIQELKGALQCCHEASLRHLSLKRYNATVTSGARNDRKEIVQTIQEYIFGEPNFDDGTPSVSRFPKGIPTLRILEIANYPLGSEGAQILTEAIAENTTLTNLRLIDCGLRSDSTNFVASMIRRNKSLVELDLSHNRHHLGSALTREMTVKTLVQRGLRYNLSLLELTMEGIAFNRTKIDRQLGISRFRKAYIDTCNNPFSVPIGLWPSVFAKVSDKPAALYFFVRESTVALFH